MTLADAVAAALFVGVIAYALFAGADFGSGFYDLTAGGILAVATCAFLAGVFLTADASRAGLNELTDVGLEAQRATVAAYAERGLPLVP